MFTNNVQLPPDEFLREYVKQVDEGNAVLFVGAGLSRAAGYEDWKQLLGDCARRLRLDLGHEQDLVAVAQYYVNVNNSRAELNSLVRSEYRKRKSLTENHRIIGRLPVGTVWTTNYDTLLERAYEEAGRGLDVKSRDEDLTQPTPERDVTLYKMHGDISRPDQVIITKGDYERYRREHPLFQQALERDLVDKTFLFLGFSFTDPNFIYTLGHLRSLLTGSGRRHYAVIREVARSDYPPGTAGDDEYDYDRNRQYLQTGDLQRYDIHTVLVERYEEVTELLKEVERRIHAGNVFVSGTAHAFGAFGEPSLKELCERLGARLIEEGFNISSGFGSNVGGPLLVGALAKLYENVSPQINKRLTVRPLPHADGIVNQAFDTRTREELISKCGFSIFIAGNSGSQPDGSPGMMEEYEITRRLGRIPIPVGATGFTAEKLWGVVEPDMDAVYAGKVSKELYCKLNDPAVGNDELLQAVFKIIHAIIASTGS